MKKVKITETFGTEKVPSKNSHFSSCSLFCRRWCIERFVFFSKQVAFDDRVCLGGLKPQGTLLLDGKKMNKTKHHLTSTNLNDIVSSMLILGKVYLIHVTGLRLILDGGAQNPIYPCVG